MPRGPWMPWTLLPRSRSLRRHSLPPPNPWEAGNPAPCAAARRALVPTRDPHQPRRPGRPQRRARARGRTAPCAGPVQLGSGMWRTLWRAPRLCPCTAPSHRARAFSGAAACMGWVLGGPRRPLGSLPGGWAPARSCASTWCTFGSLNAASKAMVCPATAAHRSTSLTPSRGRRRCACVTGSSRDGRSVFARHVPWRGYRRS